MKKFLKQFGGIMIGLLIFGGVFAAGLVQRNNSKLELSQFRMLFTNDGTIGGTAVFDINSGGNIVAYGPLLDGLLNPYITGGALSGYSTGVSLWEYTGNVLKPITTSQVKLAGGNFNAANGDYSVALGLSNKANGKAAVAIGDNTRANGDNSIAMGFSSTAAGFNSTTMGYGTIANGDYSTAMGQLSIAKGNFSSAHGLSTQANRQAATTVGQYNSGNRSSLFQVGIGIDNTDRRNGFEVTDLGNIFMNELTGYTCLATDSVGMVYDNTGVFANYVPRTAVDTGFNNTGSDTIIPSEKLVWSLVSGLNNDYIPYWDGSKFINSSILDSNNIVIGVDNSSSCIEVMPTIYDCDIGQVCPDDASVCSCEGAGSDVYAGDVCTFHGAGTGSTTTIGSGLMFFSSDDFLVSALKYEFKISQDPIYDVAKFFQHKGYFGGVKKCMYDSGIDEYECDKGAICEETQCICDTLLGFISYGEICSKTPDVDFSVINTGGSHVSISDGWVIFNGEWRLGMSGNNFVTQAFTGGVWVEKASLTND